MYGSQMRDHNWRRGGYQDINVARSLEVSSNICVSYVIDKFYHNNPEKYVGGLYRVGINEDLKLPISGYHPPKIRMPQKNKRGKYTNWSKTSLPWMSIGYETQIAPINTVTFYNAIANDGKMMRPRFVKQVVKDGVVIKDFPPEVIKEQIAKPEAIATMQTMLEHVVSQGLGKKAGSKLFKVAGKTGTTQNSFDKYFIGYTPGAVAGVWSGYEYPKSLDQFGDNFSILIWDEVMSQIYKTTRFKEEKRVFEIPNTVQELSFDKTTGMPLYESSDDAQIENGWFDVSSRPPS
jgi:cell division protein FtsI (penicillin-binding protein 3)